ncbi:MAG: sugar ABC transporter permease [Oscillospiraceae bacterium]
MDTAINKPKKNLKQKSVTMIKRNWAGWLLLLPVIFFLYIILWKPIVTGISYSFFDLKGFTPSAFVGIKNYINVLTDAVFLKTLTNTFVYVFWSLILGYLPPVIIAIMINEMVIGKNVFKFSMYTPCIMPMVAVALMWSFMFEAGDGGILNMLLSKLNIPNSNWIQDPKLSIMLIVLTMTWKNFGGTMLIYLASLQSINNELYEAATLDGAGVMKKVRYITVPHISNMLLLMFVQQIISVFQVMAEPLMMTDGGPNNASMTLNLQSYFYAFRYMDVGKSLALGVITFVILIFITMFYFRLKKKVEDSE